MVDVKIGKEVVDTLKDKKLEQSILSFENAKEIVDEYTKFLKSLKETISLKAKELLEDKEEATVTLIVDDIAVKVSFTWDTKINDEAKLNELLGDRFDDLVVTKISYAPTDKLKKMVEDDDGLKECLTIKEKAPGVTIVRA